MAIPPVDLTFPHDYELTVLTEISDPNKQRSMLYFPGQPLGRDGILVKVRPDAGQPWIGIFAFGTVNRSSGATGVWSTPDSGKLCVMSKGKGYLVSAVNPTEWQQIATDAQHLYPVTHKGLLLFSNYYELAAYGAGGKIWSFSATDELVITEIGSETIAGTSWEPATNSTEQFILDLGDGHRLNEF